MIRLLVWIAGVALIAFGTAHVGARKAPGVIMAKAVEKLSAEYNIGTNEFGHSGPITAQNQRIVRPSPDLAYSICVFDVSAGPVDVTVPKSANYMSVALYDMNTNNFFHINDGEMEKESVTLTLADGSKAGAAAADQISTPTSTGLVLVRRVISNDADWPAIKQERGKMSCRAA